MTEPQPRPVVASDLGHAPEDVYLALFEESPVPMCVYDEETLRFLAVNAAMVERYGWTRDELLTLDLLAIRRPENPAEYLAARRRAHDASPTGRGSPGTVLHWTKDAGPFDVETHWRRTRFRGRDASLLVMLDASERIRAEKELLEARTRLDQIIDQVPVSLWTTDRDLRFTWGGGGGLVVTPGSIVGRTLFEFFETDDPTHPSIAAHGRAIAQGTQQRFELRWGGYVFEMIVSPLRDAERHILGVIGVALDVTAFRRDAERLKASEAQLSDLGMRLLSLREEQQKRIARDLHDQLGQELVALGMEAARIPRHLMPGQAEVKARVDHLADGLARTLELVRDLASELRPPILQNLERDGLRGVAEWLARDTTRRAHLPCRLEIEPGLDERRIGPDLAVTAYRILKEALTNVIAHAEAEHATIVITMEAAHLRLEIRDDGKGMPDEALRNPRALGLLGMRERAEAWGGEVAFHSAPGAGTRVLVSLPLPAQGASA